MFISVLQEGKIYIKETFSFYKKKKKHEIILKVITGVDIHKKINKTTTSQEKKCLNWERSRGPQNRKLEESIYVGGM